MSKTCKCIQSNRLSFAYLSLVVLSLLLLLFPLLLVILSAESVIFMITSLSYFEDIMLKKLFCVTIITTVIHVTSDITFLSVLIS